MRVAKTLITNIHGAGKQLTIWTQGCSIHCPGCFNKNLWDFSKGKDLDFSDFFLDYSIHGVCFSGGEPLDQFDDVILFAQRAKLKGKYVIIYTGYDFRTLSETGKILISKYCDVLISGQYDPLSLPANSMEGGGKHFYFFTNSFKPEDFGTGTKMEVHISPDGEISQTGFYALPISALEALGEVLL